MKTQNNHQTYSSYYIVPAVICGMATACVATSGSVGYVILGAILGLITAGFWINVVQHDKEV